MGVTSGIVIILEVFLLKTVKRIDKKDVRENIAKNIYKEYNIVNQKTFVNRKSQKLIKMEGNYEKI